MTFRQCDVELGTIEPLGLDVLANDLCQWWVKRSYVANQYEPVTKVLQNKITLYWMDCVCKYVG